MVILIRRSVRVLEIIYATLRRSTHLSSATGERGETRLKARLRFMGWHV